MTHLMLTLTRSAAALAVAGGLLLAGTSTAVAAGNDATIAQSFSVKPGGKLILDADRGAVRVTAGEDGKVEVVVKRKVSHANEAEAAELLKAHEVNLVQEGNEIRVTARTAKVARHSWFGLQPNLEVHFEITVPKQFDARLKTAAGGIEVDGLGGAVVATTSAGALDFHKLQGPVEGRTSAGSIKALGCGAKLDLRSSAGSIEIEDFTGPSVQAVTSAGTISADLADAPDGDCAFHTSAGSITLKLPEKTAARLEARSSAGKVSSAFPVSGPGEPTRSALRGEINGGGPTLSLKTSAGSIQILKR